MPLWVHAERAKMMFPFFWKGKPDLVARDVVTQPPTASGFSEVNTKLKVVPCWFPAGSVDFQDLVCYIPCPYASLGPC